MHLHWIILACTVFLQVLGSGYGSPLFEDDRHWLDKLPSFEVKVKTDGITVRTGPSREEIYTIVAYIIFGTVVCVIFAIMIAIFVYKCCNLRRRRMSQFTTNGVPTNNSHVNLYPNLQSGGYIGPAANNTDFLVGGNSIVCTHLWPTRNNESGMSQHFDMKTGNSNEKPVSSRMYRSTS